MTDRPSRRVARARTSAAGPQCRAGYPELVDRHRAAVERRRAAEQLPGPAWGSDAARAGLVAAQDAADELLARLVAEASLTTSTTGA